MEMIRNDRIGHYIPPPTYKVPQPRPQVQQQTHGPPIGHYISPPTYQVPQQNHQQMPMGNQYQQIPNQNTPKKSENRSTLQFMNFNETQIGKPRLLWQIIVSSVTEVKRSITHCRIATGTCLLQSNISNIETITKLIVDASNYYYFFQLKNCCRRCGKSG